MGENSDELHMQLNNHISLFDRNVVNSSFEIEHFHFHGFKNIKIQILEKIFENAYELRSESLLFCAQNLLY